MTQEPVLELTTWQDNGVYLYAIHTVNKRVRGSSADKVTHEVVMITPVSDHIVECAGNFRKHDRATLWLENNKNGSYAIIGYDDLIAERDARKRNLATFEQAKRDYALRNCEKWDFDVVDNKPVVKQLETTLNNLDYAMHQLAEHGYRFYLGHREIAFIERKWNAKLDELSVYLLGENGFPELEPVTCQIDSRFSMKLTTRNFYPVFYPPDRYYGDCVSMKVYIIDEDDFVKVGFRYKELEKLHTYMSLHNINLYTSQSLASLQAGIQYVQELSAKWAEIGMEWVE